MRRGPARGAALALALLIPALTPASARAEDPGEALFARGVDAMAAGRMDEACPVLAQSYALAPRPVRLFALAECEATRGRIATAVARYDEYLALYASLPPAARQQQGNRASWARKQQAALAPDVPKLVVGLAPGAPAGAVVTRDGAVLAEAALGTPLAVDPGEHVLTAAARGGRPTEVRVRIARGEHKRVELEVLPAAPEPPSPPADAAAGRVSPRRLAAYVTGGIGLSGLIAGAVLGGLALGEKGAFDAGCNVGGVRGACTHAGKAAADRLLALGNGSTAALAVGAGAAVAATVLFVTEPARPRAVVSAGPRGIALAVVGSW
jgi:hypothetical protein